MLAEILLAALVVAVSVLVAVDVARAKTESLHEQADSLAPHATPAIAGAASRGPREAAPREPVGAAVPTAEPAAVHDAGLPRQPERISPSVGGHQQARPNASAVPKRSPHRLANWNVRSRLSLLVIIPAVAVTVIAFCVVGLTDVLHGARIHSPSSSARIGAVLSGLAIGIVLGVVLVVAVWLTIVVAKSVLRPLYRLRVRALTAASGRLPDAARSIGQSEGSEVSSDLEPVDVDSPDEIGDVARAFQQMRREMLRMASNEATLHAKLDTMFVNLSHRSQSLAERQIRLIQNLEQGEPNRERLASLSRMNRIATRMYRNSQNLLILAGHELSSGWNQPMTLVNVIRTAVSEIEEHERVSLHPQPDIAVTGPAVNDVVHMLAELAENATSFSAADMAVEISGQLLNSGGLVIDITDRGVGMSAKDLAYANWRLENPSMTDIDVPKWIGLVVVARLAARHGIRVRLQQAEFGGLTALVWLPDEVLTSQAAAVPPEFSDLSSAGSRLGSREAVGNLGRHGAEQSAARLRSAGLSQPWEDPRSPQIGRRLIADAGRRPGPAWSAGEPAPLPDEDLAVTAGRPGSKLSGAIGEQAIALDQAASAPNDAHAGTAVGGSIYPPRQSGSGSSVTGDGATSQTASALLGTTASPSNEATSAEGSVTVPSDEDPKQEARLPIYDSVESQWFQAAPGRQAPVSSGVTGNRWSSPADEGWRAAETVEMPASGTATAAGLPRRQPKANLIPGAIPATEPAALPNRSAAAARERLAGLQRGVSEGRAAVGEAANPDVREES